MVPAGATQTDLEKMDPRALSAMVMGCLAHIEHLKLVIAKLRPMHFGSRSEKAKANRHIEQLELELDGLQALCATPAPPPQTEVDAPAPPDSTSRKSRALPAHLRRETRTHFPEPKSCPGCGGAMKKLGEDVSEMLEYVPASYYAGAGLSLIAGICVLLGWILLWHNPFGHAARHHPARHV